MTQAIVLCEGYHDRAFLKGWLAHLGWWSPQTAEERSEVRDERGKAAAGQFILQKPRGGPAHVRIMPRAQAEGETESVEASRQSLFRLGTTLADTAAKPVDHLVCVVDSDAKVGHSSPSSAVEQSFRATFGLGKQPTVRAPRSGRLVSLVCWHSRGVVSATDGLPTKHTLELVVCEAISQAHPDRQPVVSDFMAAAPLADATSDGRVKEHAWAYMAKWSGTHGCDEFYQAIWEDPTVARALEANLKAMGAWDVISAL